MHDLTYTHTGAHLVIGFLVLLLRLLHLDGVDLDPDERRGEIGVEVEHVGVIHIAALRLLVEDTNLM